ncbi:hypothetical protein CFP56_038715 [Quercus suber]|uniref:Uncharacterized protein n=1 Tax=Quercus suber TaxID=58331 RepID=A0AAW0J1H9_QUESU
MVMFVKKDFKHLKKGSKQSELLKKKILIRPFQMLPKDLMMTGEDSPDTIPNDVSKEMFFPGEKLPVVDMGTYTSH